MLIDPFINAFHALHAFIFETFVLPLVRATGQTAFSSEAFDGTETFLIGLFEITLLYCLIRPLEKWRPVETFENAQDRKTDIIYTLLHRLGGFALISFAVLTPLLDGLEGELRLLGIARFQLDEMPFFSSSPLLLFIVYMIVFDFVGYWIHRAQHRVNLWWQLHALHHANTSMSLWSDNRNHLLDDMLLDIFMAMVAWLIGVEPAQYLLLVMVARMLQNLQHANVRLSFGWLGERLLVSPRFHRTHHAISSGNEGSAMGCNFGVVLPWWDVLFGTAKFNAPLEITGVRDALQGRDYGIGFWSQQRLGFLRLLGKA
jgi:sterol desaturase/sphingolipid hydroxylase (fatty acid hydroxylase superfamily)